MKIQIKDTNSEPKYDACGNKAVAAVVDEGVNLPLCQYCLEELVDSAISLRASDSDNSEFGTKFISQDRFDQLFSDIIDKGYDFVADQPKLLQSAILKGIQFAIDYMKEIYEEQRNADKSL